jgi:hypothetical protein
MLLNLCLNIVQSLAIPAQSGTKGSNNGINSLHRDDPQISHIVRPQGWIVQNCLSVAVHTLTVRLRDVSQRTRIGTLIVTVGSLTVGSRKLALGWRNAQQFGEPFGTPKSKISGSYIHGE